MVDLKRTISGLNSIYPDNSNGDISPQDLRDGFASVVGSMYVSAVTNDVNITSDHIFLEAITSGGDITITLPSVSGTDVSGVSYEHKYYVFYNNGENTLTVSAQDGTINSLSYYNIPSDKTLSLISNNSEWLIFNKTDLSASDILDITENVQDTMNSTLSAGPNIQITYDDNNGKIEISATQGVTDHTALSNIGTNTHSQIDSQLSDINSTSGNWNSVYNSVNSTSSTWGSAGHNHDDRYYTETELTNLSTDLKLNNLSAVSISGDNIDQIGYIDFRIDETYTSAIAHAEGRLKWDATEKTLNMDSSINDVSLQVGQETWVYVVNKTGTTIPNGCVVYIDGAQGNRPTITSADNQTDQTSDQTIGVVTHEIPNNNNGYVTTFGLVRGLDTSDYSEGDTLYLSTSGTYTNIQPETPLHEVRLGSVISSNANNGIIFVNVEHRLHLFELHDVDNLVNNVKSVDGYYIKSSSSKGYWTSGHFETDVNNTSTLTNLISTSANWNNVYSDVNSTSGNWDNAFTHVSSDGSDHTYIDQDVTTTGTPQFTSVSATSISSDSFAGITSAHITNFVENIQDTINETLSAGSNITLTYDDDNGNLRIDASTGGVTEVSSTDVIYGKKIGSPTVISNLQQYINNVGSSMIVSGGIITSASGGTINVTSGVGLIRDGSKSSDHLYSFEFTSSAGITLTSGVENFIYITYNNGSPTYGVDTSLNNVTLNNELLIGSVYKTNTNRLYITSAGQRFTDYFSKNSERLWVVHGAQRGTGLITSEVGSRYIGVSTGTFYVGNNKMTTPAINTSATDTFSYFYRNGSGGWIEQTGQTQINNTFYDNNSGTLQTLTSNKYAVTWLFMQYDGSINAVYGQADRVLAEAIDAKVPSSLPNVIADFGFLIAKIIIQKSASSTYSIETPWARAIPTGTVTDHGNLAGLTDDDHTQYLLANSNRAFTGTLTGANLNLTGNITLSGTVDGRDISTDGTTLDNHITSASVHFTEASIDHTAIQNIGSNTHVQIDSQLTDINSTSGNWNSSYNSVNSTSGNWDNAFTHVSSDGSDHTYIDQDVTTTGTPQFTSVSSTSLTSDTITSNGDVIANRMGPNQGSEGSPSYTFTSDIDTGFWNISANAIGIQLGGSSKVGIYSDGHVSATSFEGDGSQITGITSGGINNFTENIQDVISETLSAGSNITITYDDDNGKVEISSTGGGTISDEVSGNWENTYTNVNTNSANWDSAFTHISSDGSDHTFINQNVTSSSTPTFSGMDVSFEKITSLADPTTDNDAANKSYTDTKANTSSKAFADGLLAKLTSNGGVLGGNPALTTQIVLKTDDGKAQIGSCDNNNEVTIYANGTNFADGVVKTRTFLKKGQIHIETGLTAGAIITSDKGVYGASGNENTGPMPLGAEGLAGTKFFVFAFRSSDDPSGINRGEVYVATGAVGSYIELLNGSGDTVVDSVTLEPFSLGVLATNANAEFQVVATQPVFVGIAARTGALQQYDLRLVPPLSTDIIGQSRSTRISSLYDNTVAYIYQRDGDIGKITLSPGSPIQIDSGTINELGDVFYIESSTPAASAGTFTITISGHTTGNIDFDADQHDIRSALLEIKGTTSATTQTVTNLTSAVSINSTSHGLTSADGIVISNSSNLALLENTYYNNLVIIDSDNFKIEKAVSTASTSGTADWNISVFNDPDFVVETTLKNNLGEDGCKIYIFAEGIFERVAASPTIDTTSLSGNVHTLTVFQTGTTNDSMVSTASYGNTGITRIIANGPICGFSGADGSGAEATPFLPVSLCSQRIPIPMAFPSGGNGNVNGIQVSSPYKGNAELYDHNGTLLKSFSFDRGSPVVSASCKFEQRFPTGTHLNGSTSTGNGIDQYWGLIAWRGGYVESDVPINVILNTNENEQYIFNGIFSHGDETLMLGITPENCRAEIRCAGDGRLRKRTIANDGSETWELV